MHMILLFVLGLWFTGVSQSYAMTMHQHEQIESHQPTIKISDIKMVDREGKKVVQFKLQNMMDGSLISLNDIKEVHTQKVHLLIIDESLQDYSHIHPQEGSEKGSYVFEWTPKTQNNYRLWADLTPLKTNTQEFAMADLIKDRPPVQPLKTISLESQMNGYKFQLSFEESKISAGQAAMGKITITDSRDQPVKDLQPIMGAFAHIVGFLGDFKTIMHVHPLNKEPTNENDRAGPDINFHMETVAPGFIKLFAQIIIKGQEMFVPFGVFIEEAKSN